MLAPAFRAAVMQRLAGSTGTSAAVRGVIETVATTFSNAESYDDFSFVAQDYLANLPMAMLQAWPESENVVSLMPNGAVSLAVISALARASWSARSAWCSKLEYSRVFRPFKRYLSVPLAEKSPSVAVRGRGGRGAGPLDVVHAA